jgi:hypothetical protein
MTDMGNSFTQNNLMIELFGFGSEILGWAGIIFGFIIFLVLLRMSFRRYIINSQYYDHAIFLVRLPKNKPGDTQKEFTAQEMREELAKGETIFASIGGLRAQRGFKAMLFGRNDHFSFEIVAHKRRIAFYMAVPRNWSEYLQQQVQAHYPDAVMEEVDDYNIFHPNYNILAGYMRTTRHNIFPIRTYTKMETDPMNSLVNEMSKLSEDEGIAIQYVVRSARAGWHRNATDVVRKVHRENKTVNQALQLTGWRKIMSGLGDMVKAAKPPNPNSPQEMRRQQEQYQPKRLSAMEEEMLKGIEEKNAKAGLDVNIRIIVSTANKGKSKMYLDNLSSAFGQYNHYQYGNSFRNRIKVKQIDKLAKDFIYRRFDQNISFLLNSEEMTGLYHLPLRTAETPNILWLTAKHAPAPSDIPEQGIMLGKNIYRGQVKNVHIKRVDRRRHMYIIGKSGTGKSKFIAGMAIQDILNGEGVCLLDPHGDLIADVISRVPPERAEDVVLFAPADTDRPMALNLLEYDSRYPEQKTFVINEMIKIFDKLYDLKSTGGPIFEQYIRNAMLLIMSDPETGSTLMEVPRVLADAEFRRMKLERCGDPTVVDFWRKEAEKAGGDAALANVVPYITSKLTQFISNDTMRPIIGQQKSSFNLRDLMDKRKILLIDLSKGRVGEMNSYLLGMILVGKILMSALSRTDMPEDKRPDFYLYIDEFQNFTTDSINSILSEARKYNLNLIIAHQYIGQLIKSQDTSIKDAVFGNVGTIASFKIGSDDAEFLEKEFNPVFNQYDLVNVEKYTAYLKLLVDNASARPFSMHTLWPLPGNERPEIADKIKALSRLKYGQERALIEAQIRKRTLL